MPTLNKERGDRVIPVSGPDNRLSVNVYRAAGYGDCTNGGVTASHDTVYLVNEDETRAVISEGGNAVNEPRRTPALRVIERGGYLRAVPVGLEDRWTMFGGNFVHCSDSRFFQITPYPIPVHDRIEP